MSVQGGRWAGRWRQGWVDGGVGGWVDGSVGGWVDRGVGGWVDGGVDRWMGYGMHTDKLVVDHITWVYQSISVSLSCLTKVQIIPS